MSRGSCAIIVLASAAVLVSFDRAAADEPFKTLYSFTGGTTDIPDGEYPIAGVIVADESKGTLIGPTFGTAGQGEPGRKCPKCDNNGSIDVIQPDGSATSYVFKPGEDGAFPAGELAVDAGGTGAFYGTTEYGRHTGCGGLGCGTVFKLGSADTLQPVVISDFCLQADCVDGAFPRAGLTSDGNGNLFGTTLLGGTGSGYLCGSTLGGCGTIYEVTGRVRLDPPLYSFCIKPRNNLCDDGAIPSSRLLYLSGNLYGTTEFGGLYGHGTVFELFKARGKWKERVLYSFCATVENDVCTDGNIPEAGLVADMDGNLYGTTTFGGQDANCDGNPGCGVVFSLVPSTRKQTVLHRFMGKANNDGALPVAQLAIDQTANVLYGTTLRGQGVPASDCHIQQLVLGCGTIFRVTTTGKGYEILHTFVKATDGAQPEGALLLSADANTLYGTARIGGEQTGTETACKCGTIYKYTLSFSAKSAAKLHDGNGASEKRVN